MRPLRSLATALLVASLAITGCSRSQPDQSTSPPSQPSVVTEVPAPPAPPSPDPAPPTPGPTPRPRVLSITTIPDLPRDGGFRVLPPGAGTIVFRVRAVNAQRVRFYLTPTGAAMFNERQLIGQDTNGRDGWLLTWRYPGGGMIAHLTVIAVGANGAPAAYPRSASTSPPPNQPLASSR